MEEKFKFLTPILVVLNLFVTTLLAGDLFKDIVEKLFQDIMDDADKAILVIILSYIIYFIGLYLIITLRNKVFDEKEQEIQNNPKELGEFILNKSVPFESKTNIDLNENNISILTNISIENPDVKTEKNLKYSDIILKGIILISLLFVFGFKILLTVSTSEVSGYIKLIFIALQVCVFMIVFCCILQKDIQKINSFGSLFFMNEDKKKTNCKKAYEFFWNGVIIILLIILCHLTMIIFGIEAIEDLREMLSNNT